MISLREQLIRLREASIMRYTIETNLKDYLNEEIENEDNKITSITISEYKIYLGSKYFSGDIELIDEEITINPNCSMIDTDQLETVEDFMEMKITMNDARLSMKDALATAFKISKIESKNTLDIWNDE